MDDDEDIIIEEIPVFVSKNLQDNLFLFQYPTKTQVTNHDNATIVNCCVKPINQEVKVDFGLDIDSAHYDSFKGEQFAIAADGKSTTTTKGEKPTFRRGVMDKQAFISTRSLTDVRKYIVGIYADKEIHLSPLTSIVQLRPSFSHFDKDDKRKKAEQKALNEEDEDEELQHVTVKFARTGGNAKKIKEHPGYDSFVKRIVEEPWCETYWHSRTSPTAELERQKLYATNHQANQTLSLEPSRYLDKLMPSDEHVQKADTVVITRVVNKSFLKTMPLMDQLKVLLQDAKMLSFSDVMRLLTEHIDQHIASEKVLRTLQQVGVLLHGNWVAQSEILYPAESLSNANGVSADLMIRARDYVLFRFSRTTFLHRNQVTAATQLPSEEGLEVLQTVARLNSTKTWELLLPPDKDFEARHPELVQRQEMVWRATEQTYNEMDYDRSPKRVRKRSVREAKPQQQPSSSTDIQPT